MLHRKPWQPQPLSNLPFPFCDSCGVIEAGRATVGGGGVMFLFFFHYYYNYCYCWQHRCCCCHLCCCCRCCCRAWSQRPSLHTNTYTCIHMCVKASLHVWVCVTGKSQYESWRGYEHPLIHIHLHKQQLPPTSSTTTCKSIITTTSSASGWMVSKGRAVSSSG